MRRVRLVSALIAVISLVYLVLYKLVLIDWMTVHYWLFPSVLQLLVFRPAFCFSSALFVASLFGASSRGGRARRLVRIADAVVLVAPIALYATCLVLPAGEVRGVLVLALGQIGSSILPWATTLLGALTGFTLKGSDA